MNEHVDKLEGLLYAQAMSLADQHQRKGREASAQIQQELDARLDALRAGEEQRFEHEAALRCRQRVQGATIRLQSETDRLRWTLAQDVLAGVRQRLDVLVKDTARYHAALQGYLAEAASAMPAGDLVAEVLPRDLDALKPGWNELVAAAAPDRKVELAPLPDAVSGGMRIRSSDGTLRVDNTFEGRLARMHEDILRIITTTLFEDGDDAA